MCPTCRGIREILNTNNIKRFKVLRLDNIIFRSPIEAVWEDDTTHPKIPVYKAMLE